MRNTHTLVLLAMPILLAAQQGTPRAPEPFTRKPLEPLHASGTSSGAVRSGEDALWYEDFESGLGGWQVETSVGNVDWRVTSTGNTGGYTPGPLESSSGYPGGQWIVADSDAEGTAGQPEHTTITSPSIQGFDTVHLMLLRFEQSFRQLNDDQTIVEVSGNGGAVWTSYPVNTDITGNHSTPGAPQAQVVTINISAALTTSCSDIRIRFTWISDEGFTYSWQVDDVALLPVRPNDLTLYSATHAAWSLDEPTWAGMPCTIYPLGEVRELRFKGVVGNNGSAPQTNVRLKVEVNGHDGYTATLYSDPMDLQPGEVDSLFIEDYTPPNTVDEYDFDVSAVQDQVEDVPADNTANLHIRVDEQVFARDERIMASARDNNGADFELGNRFYVNEWGRTLEGVDVALGPGTEPGAIISAMVYDGYFNYIGQSDIHVVSADEINAIGGMQFITLPLMTPEELDGERIYLVCVYAQVNDGAVQVGISGNSPAQTSMIYRYDMQNWYYTGSTPMVRMRLNTYVGIDGPHGTITSMVAKPSVFETSTLVMFELEEAADAGWELRDMSGRLVRREVLGRLAPGAAQVEVHGDGLADGMYTFTLHSGDGSASVKLVHQARR